MHFTQLLLLPVVHTTRTGQLEIMEKWEGGSQITSYSFDHVWMPNIIIVIMFIVYYKKLNSFYNVIQLYSFSDHAWTSNIIPTW